MEYAPKEASLKKGEEDFSCGPKGRPLSGQNQANYHHLGGPKRKPKKPGGESSSPWNGTPDPNLV